MSMFSSVCTCFLAVSADVSPKILLLKRVMNPGNQRVMNPGNQASGKVKEDL